MLRNENREQNATKIESQNAAKIESQNAIKIESQNATKIEMAKWDKNRESKRCQSRELWGSSLVIRAQNAASLDLLYQPFSGSWFRT